MNKLRFIDLFAGVGGIRLGFERACKSHNITTECVLSSEIDDKACETYTKNFYENPKLDITSINEKDVPDCDVVLAGFPCQAFSIAGKRGGFNDTRGTLFFDPVRINNLLKKIRLKILFSDCEMCIDMLSYHVGK